MLGEYFAEQTVSRTLRPLAAGVSGTALEPSGAAGGTDVADQCRAEHDDGERNIEKEDADKRRRCERNQNVVVEGTLADPEDRLQDDGKHRGLEAEEQRSHERDGAEGRV